MSDYQKTRRRRRSRLPRAQRTLLAALVAVAAMLAAWSGYAAHSPATPIESYEIAPQAGGAFANVVDSHSPALPGRANYNYSVIPGGAHSAQELAHAIETDVVVADHYRDVDPQTMRPERVAAERYAYVSYRKNDRVFWTKNKVRIYEGETVLSNGQTEIRARCGNAISLAPLLPTSEDEPDEAQFDALTDVGPLVVTFNMTPAGLPFVTAPSLADGEVVAPPLDSFLPVGVGGFATGPMGAAIVGIPGDSGSGFAAPPIDEPVDDSSVLGDPSDFDPFDPSDPFVPGDQSNPPDSDILVLQPLLEPDLFPDPDPGGPTVRQVSTDNPTPVPEPASLLLFGSGIAALLARRARVKSNERDAVTVPQGRSPGCL